MKIRLFRKWLGT